MGVVLAGSTVPAGFVRAVLDLSLAKRSSVPGVTLTLVALNSIDAFAVDAGRVAAVILVVLAAVASEARWAVTNVGVGGVAASAAVQAGVAVVTLVDVDCTSLAFKTEGTSAFEPVMVVLADTSIQAGAGCALVNINLATGPSIA